MKRIMFLILLCTIILLPQKSVTAHTNENTTTPISNIINGVIDLKNPIWAQLLEKYKTNDTVKQIIFVEYQANSDAVLKLYTKNVDGWDNKLVVPAQIGQNGLGKEIEGDNKTPVGDFGIFTAAGIKPNPGTKADYVLFDNHIFAAEGPYYNKLLDTRIHPASDVKTYDGDTFSDAEPQFNYSLFLDYNKECIPGKGSYIFLHCKGEKPYTHGCVAVSEEAMVSILNQVDNNVRVCIFPQEIPG